MTRVSARGLIILVALCGFLRAESVCADRDLSVIPKAVPGSVPISGEYWALIIGIDEYQHAPKLETAVRDAQAVREVLVQRYGFARERINELINSQATRRNIEDALYQLRKKAGKEDSVLIFYAGHGQMDKDDDIGYWVPADGEPQSPGTFISNARIRDEVGKMKARHVYLVADSCFAGSLFAARRGTLPPLNDKFFARLYQSRSRWGLTSGMNEPVTDKGKDGHSVFAYFFLKLLSENEDPYLVPSHIYDQIGPLVGRNADQQPRSEPLQGAGDEGGQFVFRLAMAGNLGGLAPAKPVPVPGVSSDDLGSSAKDLARMKTEMEAPKAEIKPPKSVEPKPIEEARVRPYESPKTSREITGKDGALMVLIPSGDFMMGGTEGDADEKPMHRVSLDAFYLDKYEVTNKLFQKFVRDTGYETTAEKNGSAYGCNPSNECKVIGGASWRKPDRHKTGTDLFFRSVGCQTGSSV